jgi:hypothetical protein
MNAVLYETQASIACRLMLLPSEEGVILFFGSRYAGELSPDSRRGWIFEMAGTHLYSFSVIDTFNRKCPTAHHRRGSYRLEKNNMAPARIPSERGIFSTGLRFSENRIHEIFGLIDPLVDLQHLFCVHDHSRIIDDRSVTEGQFGASRQSVLDDP